MNEVLVVGLGSATAVTDAEPARVVVLIALDELGDEELAVAIADEGFGGATHGLHLCEFACLLHPFWGDVACDDEEVEYAVGDMRSCE